MRTYASGDTIIERGSIGTTMYFMDLGTARAEIRYCRVSSDVECNESAHHCDSSCVPCLFLFLSPSLPLPPPHTLSFSGQTATELKSGDYFGEIAFAATCNKFLRDKSDTSVSPNRRRCDCRHLHPSPLRSTLNVHATVAICLVALMACRG